MHRRRDGEARERQKQRKGAPLGGSGLCTRGSSFRAWAPGIDMASTWVCMHLRKTLSRMHQDVVCCCRSLRGPSESSHTETATRYGTGKAAPANLAIAYLDIELTYPGSNFPLSTTVTSSPHAAAALIITISPITLGRMPYAIAVT